MLIIMPTYSVVLPDTHFVLMYMHDSFSIVCLDIHGCVDASDYFKSAAIYS